MKKYIIPVLASLALLASCAKFDEMNTDPTAVTDAMVQPHFIFGRLLYHGMCNDHQRNFNLNDDMYASISPKVSAGRTTGVTTRVGAISTGVTSTPSACPSIT